MKRSYPSGAQKRKAAEEKKKKDEQLLKTVPKISNMIGFSGGGSSSSRSDTSTNAPSTSTSGISTTIISHEDETEHPEQQNDFEEVAGSATSAASICEQQNENPGESFMPDPDGLLPFPTDAALWDMDSGLASLQAFWVKNG